jgi:hypothetical protein
MAQRKLADEIVSVDDDDVRVRIAEAMYRVRVARLNLMLALAYWIATRIHGQEKTSLLFCRFLLHAKRVENNDFIGQMLETGVRRLREGALNSYQFGTLTHIVRKYQGLPGRVA